MEGKMKKNFLRGIVLIMVAIFFAFGTACTDDSNKTPSDDANQTAAEQRIESVLSTIKNYPKIVDSSYYDFSKLGKIKLGAYFWYGFSYMGDHYTDRLYQEFSEREPVWGWTESSVENMEEQIEYAAASGLAYFAFDWYYNSGMKQSNSCVDKFIEAKNSEKMEFCLNVCNHEGAYITNENFTTAAKTWLKYFQEDNYLKVDNKPVLMFFSSYYLQYYLGGTANCVEAFQWLNQEAQKLGFDGVKIIGTEVPYGSVQTRDIDFNLNNYSEEIWKKVTDDRKAQGFDALTGYNYRRYSPIELADGTSTYCVPYTLLTSDHETSWQRFADVSYPYVPCILGGWDCRPWETAWSGNSTGYRSCYGADRTPKDLYNHILNAAKFLDQNPECSVGNLCVIYAWNEYCEGGYIAPCKGDDGRYCGAIRQAVEKINGSV